MILVDVFVPAIAKSYDFCIDEAASVSTVLEEICEMICQKEHWPEVQKRGEMTICCLQTASLLPLNASLGSCGVRNGYRLLLI